MGQIERIEVMRIYLGTAVKLGLLYGLLIGLIVGISLLSMNLFSGSDPAPTNLMFFSIEVPGGVILGALLLVVGFVATGALGIVLVSLFYNLSAKLGGRLSFGLIEHMAVSKPAKVKKKDVASENVGQKNSAGVSMASAGSQPPSQPVPVQPASPDPAQPQSPAPSPASPQPAPQQPQPTPAQPLPVQPQATNLQNSSLGMIQGRDKVESNFRKFY